MTRSTHADRRRLREPPVALRRLHGGRQRPLLDARPRRARAAGLARDAADRGAARQKPASRWRGLFSGQAVVAYAYAAAVLVMLMG